jgi:serine/threonine protein kinase
VTIHPGAQAPGSPTAGGPADRDEEDYWDRLVDRLFLRDDSPGRSFNRRSRPSVLLPDRLCRVELSPADDPRTILEAYLVKGVGPGVAPMWNRQMRSLLRLRALGHPGLPKLYMGKYDPDEPVAYAVTTLEGRTLAEAGHRWRDDEKLQAVEQFTVLVDALSQLHSIGIHHRNIHLDAIRVSRDEEADDQYRCQLGRFEVSGLVRGLMGMRSGTVDESAHTAMREMTLRPPQDISPARHLGGLAPELFPYLFGDAATLRTDTATTDVFGLGVIGWEWFCGPIEEVLPEEFARLAAATGDGCRAPVEELQQQMLRHLSRAAVPKQLAIVLRGMIERDPGARATAFEAAAALSACWPALQVTFDERDQDQALLLAYMPKESGRTVWEMFEWIDHNPADSQGQQELEDLLERDLHRAELIHVPGGALGYVRSTTRSEAQKEAEWVLIGERALWFASYLREPRHDSPPNPQVLVIRFVLEKESWAASRLLRVRPRRLVGRVRLVPYRPGQPLGLDTTASPPWQPLAGPLRRREKVEGREFLQSIDFLQEYLETQMRARWYPFERVGADGQQIIVRHDHKRDRERARRNELLEAYLAFPRARPSLGDFIDSLGRDETQVVLNVGYDRDGRPSFRDGFLTGVRTDADRDLVRLEPFRGEAVPARGWLRVEEDKGTDIQLDRQAKARRLLDDRPGLVEQLTSPTAVDVAVEFIDDSYSTGLDGDKAEAVVRDICTVEPLYALQGPPGTGKSTVATAAIVKYLDLQPYTRLLVSAQSNDALNSIGAKIIESVDLEEVVIVRATSRASEVEHAVVGEYTLEKLQDRYKAIIKGSVRGRLAGGGTDDPTSESPEENLLRRWLERVDGNVVELGERLRRAAQITLATCSTSALVLDYSRDGAAVFDWVLVEEAAKAWPNELLIPLVQGLRWTLIGDHRQLGAHRRDDLERFLEFLAGRGTVGAQRHARLADQHLRFLNLFGSMFNDLGEETAGKPPGGRGEELARAASQNPADDRKPKAVNRLVHQFRMHPAIAEMVGRAFYPTSAQKEAREPETGLPPTILDSSYVEDLGHDLTDPGYLRRRPLVWLSTDEVGRCGDEPSWFNHGEAEVVAHLATMIDDSRSPLSVAVLSPYRRQLDEIEKLAPRLRGRLHTVHSFQGSEADVVLVSLVRDTHRGPSIQANLGFVAQDEIINVMLSRARRLLVVVGNLEHFREHGETNWKDVILGFEHFGKVVKAGREHEQ